MDRRRFLAASAGALSLAACAKSGTSSTGPSTTTGVAPPTTGGTRPPTTTSTTATPTTQPPPVPGTPAEVLSRSHVPVLCYHQLRDFEPDDGQYARTIITPPAVLRTQLEALGDGGYTPVTARAVVDHLQLAEPLPDKAVLLSFDDGSVTHRTVGLPLLAELGFPAIFFPMTVVLGKERWLTSDHLRELDAAGMEIGVHSYDHQRMDRLSGDQWAEQITEPKAELEEIVGHPIDLMAYPNGLWTQEALGHVADAGFRAAFQLADPTDTDRPLLTIRRILPPPTWDGASLVANLAKDF